ncbi:MAG: S-layer homology domain-containing protein [Sedimentibacter sp.]|uniref:S-layer homology domain-containing protein n=1 Tax=Sedimentibacter sp. TaxID=1960295 RepID=UPI003158B52A
MKIFKTTTRKIILLIFVFVFAFNTLAFAGSNPSRAELESMIDEVARERAVPSVLLKAIARVESVFEQFNSDGTPKISGSSIGLMQVSNRNGGYDSNRLKYDIRYNIEAGADVLLNKWSMSSYQSLSSVGNMDPNILENWYFALWAYNGWAQSNNPNIVTSYAKKYTYQQMIYNVIEKEYGKKVSNIDFSYLPSSGLPSRSLVVPTPAYASSGDIVFYEKNDYVRTDGVRDSYQLRDEPAGKYIRELEGNQLGIITDGPVLKNGFYWYKVYVDENTEGWIERNWLLRTGDTEHGRYVYDDIAFHWARKDIMDLYNKGIISESKSFNPDSIATKEEFFIFLSKAIDVNNEEDSKEVVAAENEASTTEGVTTIEDSKLPFSDASEIHPWAVTYIEDVYDRGLLKSYREELEPLERLTRKEATIIMDGIFDEDQKYENLDITTVFKDLGNLSQEEKEAIKTAYTNGLISGKGSGSFCPDDYLSRAEAAAIMVKVSEKLEEVNSLN